MKWSLLLVALVSLGLLLRWAWSDGGVSPNVPQAAATATQGAAPDPGEDSPAWPVPEPVDREAVAALPDAAPVPTVTPVDTRDIEVFGRVCAKATGSPIGGATVRSTRTSTTTDPDGRFRIMVTLVGGSALLTVTAAGFADSTTGVRAFEARQVECEVAMVPTGQLTLRVVDRASGHPIADAEVRPMPNGAVLARSAADGRFTVDVVEGRQKVLFVSADGYSPLRWHWLVDLRERSTSPCLPLTRPVRIEGRVTDGNGRAMPAASVQCSSPYDAAECWPEIDQSIAPTLGHVLDESPHAVAETDADGRFGIDLPPRSRARLVVAHREDCARSEPAELWLRAPGDVARVDLVLSPAAIVRGTVRCQGRPFARGYVFWQHGGARGRDYVKHDGSYELRNLPAARIELFLRQGFSVPDLVTTSVDAVAGEVVQQDFEWSGYDGTITGRVTGPDGRPRERVGVHVLDAAGAHITGATTDAEGAYRVDVARGGVYSVCAWGGSIPRRRDGVQPDASGIDFVLAAAAQLRLRLVDASTQRPLPFVGRTDNMVAWRESGAAAFVSVGGEVDSTGLLVVHVAAGRVDLALDFQQHGYRPWRAFGMVAPAHAAGEVRVELVRGSELRLSMPGFAPSVRRGHALYVLEGAQLAAVRGPDPKSVHSASRLEEGVGMLLDEPGLRYQMPKFDTAGHARLTGLAPGRYRLVAFPDDFVFEPATFLVGEGDAEVELQWRRR